MIVIYHGILVFGPAILIRRLDDVSGSINIGSVLSPVPSMDPANIKWGLWDRKIVVF